MTQSDNRDIAIVSEEGTSKEAVRCPICKGHHPVKRDRRGKEFVTLSCIGAGSNVFPRTPLGKGLFKEWKRDALVNPPVVSIPVPTVETGAPSAPLGIGGNEDVPSVDPLETVVRRFLERNRQRSS